jgi:hypothetical protein
MPFTATAQSLEPPSDYDSLLEKYEEMYQIAQEAMDLADERKAQADKWKNLYEKEREDKLEYKKLYEQSEKNLEATMKSNERLQDMIDRLDNLLKESLKKSDLSLNTGIVYTPINPENTGILVGFQYGF